jgi:hypothetical protein
MMTQGVIVYLLGEGKPPEGLKTGAYYQGICQATGPMEVVVSQPGVLELDDAWHFLLSLGCETIHLLVAMAEHDRLSPLYPLVRLTGISRMAGESSNPSFKRRVLH